MKKPQKISLIVTTFNSPKYLEMVLERIGNQKNPGDFEVIIADDGSTSETSELIKKIQSKASFPLFHFWHEDKGFRAAAARNGAARIATGDYLVFLDGDCLVFDNFILKHRAIAERSWFVRGSRVMLGQELSANVIENGIQLTKNSPWISMRMSGKVNRLGPLLKIPFMEKRLAYKWYGVKTCNLGIWRSDFEAVNGFDERYIGWGYEDSDLAVRLINKGVLRKEGRSNIPVVHFWHEREMSWHQHKNKEVTDNKILLDDTILRKSCYTYDGLVAKKHNVSEYAGLHILHANFAKGFRGGERQTALLITELAKAGAHQTVLLRYDSPLIELLAQVKNVKIRRIKKPYSLYFIAKKDEYSFVHSHETKAAQWAYINFRFWKVPYFITRRVARIPRETAVTRDIYQQAITVLCLSSAVQKKLLKTAPKSRTYIVPDMCAKLPVDMANVENMRNQYSGSISLLHVGALVREKGQYELIDAFRILKKKHKINLLLLGDGNHAELMKSYARGEDGIHFLGFHQNVGDFLASADLFAFPSHEEGLGSTLLDAMNAGLPIVASNVDGIPDLIKDNVNGLLVPVKNSKELAEAIQSLIEDNTLAQRLADNGRNYVKQYYPENLVQKYLEIYRHADLKINN